MNKRISAFFAGFCASALTLTLGTSALAASGKIIYNFAGVSLDGVTKITAGADLTAANGASVPSTILYTDERGGKTNYLPVRAISELLGVQVGYDSSTDTVLLGQQLAAETAAPVWRRELEGASIGYACSAGEISYDALPTWRPTALGTDWSLTNISQGVGGSGNAGLSLTYSNGSGRLHLQCVRPCNASMGTTVKTDAAKALRQITVQGHAADFYQGDSTSLLVWQNENGMLFWLSGLGVEQTVLTAAAESVAPYTGHVRPYVLNWMPEGYTRHDAADAGFGGSETWVQNGDALTWIYTADGNLPRLPDWEAETVTVQGRTARYWAPTKETEDEGATVTVGGETTQGGGVVVSGGVTVESVTAHGAAESGTLVWTDAQGVTCFLQGLSDRATLLRMAESVTHTN